MRLWSEQGRGCLHTQSKRFLDPSWPGLGVGGNDLPLRSWVEKLAQGETVQGLRKEDPQGTQPLLHWLSSFKLDTCHSMIFDLL